MPAIYDKILSCFAVGLGHKEDFFREVCASSFCPHMPSATVAIMLAKSLI